MKIDVRKIDHWAHRSALLLILALLTPGCASYFTRKSCEGTNWFEYGHRVAMEGRRLSGDDFLAECRKVEAEINETELDRGFKGGMAKYCMPESVFDLGKRGEFFSAEMCDGENPRLLGEKHKLGVAEYCKKSNGYSAGALGKPYNRICPKAMEAEFLPEFRRGRKKYLSVLVIQNERKVNDIDREVYQLERERNDKALEMQRLQMPVGSILERRYDPYTGTYREQVSTQMTDEQKRRVDDVRWKIQNLDSQISSKRKEQSDLRDQNSKIQLEIVQLDDPKES